MNQIELFIAKPRCNTLYIKTDIIYFTFILILLINFFSIYGNLKFSKIRVFMFRNWFHALLYTKWIII